VPSFKVKFSGVTILQGFELSIFLLIFEWALQQCSATALPVIAVLLAALMTQGRFFKYDARQCFTAVPVGAPRHSEAIQCCLVKVYHYYYEHPR